MPGENGERPEEQEKVIAIMTVTLYNTNRLNVQGLPPAPIAAWIHTLLGDLLAQVRNPKAETGMLHVPRGIRPSQKI